MRKWLVVLLLILLIGCGEKTLDQGIVTQKEHLPYYSWVQLIPIPISCGAHCISYIYIPYTYVRPESWKLYLRDCPEPQKCHDGVAYVSMEKWEELNQGDYYSLQKGEAKDPIYRKKGNNA